MSTVMYLVCESHEPNIFSDEVGHYLSDLARIRAVVKNRVAVVESLRVIEGEFDSGVLYQNATARFLYYHPDCDLRIEDEYKQVYPLVDPGEKGEKPERQTSIGRVKAVHQTDEGLTIEFSKLTAEGKRVLRLMGVMD